MLSLACRLRSSWQFVVEERRAHLKIKIVSSSVPFQFFKVSLEDRCPKSEIGNIARTTRQGTRQGLDRLDSVASFLYIDTMLLLASFLSFLSLSYASATERATFHDDLVLRCFPETTEHLDFLHDMSENDKMNLDFWLEPKRIGGPVDIMMNNKQQELMMKMMDVIGVSCKVLIPNVQDLVDGERVRSTKNTNVTTPFFLDYHPWQEVQEYITDLVCRFAADCYCIL